jgi:hypothetical protein
MGVMAVDDPAGTLTFYDAYVRFPYAAVSDRADDRVMAEFRFGVARGDGNTDSWSIRWTCYEPARSDRTIIRIDLYADSAAAFAASGLGELIGELHQAHNGDITPDQLTAALEAAGWRNDTGAEPLHALHCPTCGSDGYTGPAAIANWRRRVADTPTDQEQPR